MNPNRKFEDVKINTKKVLIKKPQEEVRVSSSENHNPTHISPRVEVQNNLSKYDFLDKKIKKQTFSNPRIPQTPRLPSSRKPLGNKILFLFIITLIIGLYYLLSTTFLHANVTLIAKNMNFELKNQKFTASKVETSNTIPFTLTVVSGVEERDVVLTSSKEASEKAKGNITLYNEYSAKGQKITAGTFVSDEDGKTYKIDTTVSIPGYKIDKTKKIIPGTISVGITAFLSGESYNGEPNNFFVNSFKGTDKYKKIYGKAETALTGGITGLVYLIDDKQRLEIESLNFSKLKEKLFNKIEVPLGYILYEDTVRYDIYFDENLVSKTPDTKIEIKGTVSAMLLKESVLSDSLISKLLPNISTKEKAQVLPPDISKLSFVFTNKDQFVNKDVDTFNFELKGNLNLKWNPYTEELRSALVGYNKNEVSSILKQDPGISSASVKIVPFWSKKLPPDPKKINILLN